MKERTKVTSALNTKITNDWLSAFPGLGRYRPKWIMRRIGPLVMGITLQPLSFGEYRPIFHVFNLATRMDFIGLSLYQTVHTGDGYTEIWIDYGDHDRKWAEAAALFRSQIAWPLEGDVSLKFALEAYDRYSAQEFRRRDDYYYFADRIAYASWCGQHDLALQILEKATLEISKWPLDLLQNWEVKGFELKGWALQQSALAQDSALVRSWVTESIERFKMQNLRVSELICDCR